jgi:hypothetical protein
MNEKEVATIDAYIPAAHLMVQARDCTDTLNEAVEWVKERNSSFSPAYLRLLWVGVNAQCLSHENRNVDVSCTHPDYELEEMRLSQLERQSPLLCKLVDELTENVEQDDTEARLWLGTKLINGQRCQVQLVVTPIDSHFVDED